MRDGPPRRSSIDDSNRFELLVSSITDYAIFMLDKDGFVTSWNPGAERAKGYLASEILGQHFSVFYGPEDRAAEVPARALATAAREGRFEAEGWRFRKDGTRFWANVVIDPIRAPDGDLVGFAKITRDLTDRKKAQEALRESEERFRLLVRSVTDYAIYMLDPDGYVTNWNAGAQRIKGYSEEEIVGRHFSDFYTPEDREAGLPKRALAIAAREGRYEKEGWRLRKDGSRFLANVVIDPIRNDLGQLIGFAKITRDITERRAGEEALERARNEAHQAQKMAAIAQLSSGIAHDFNNLLTVVMGNLDLLRRATEERRPKLIENAMSAADQARKLTGKLLAFSRRQRLFPEIVDLGRTISGMEDMLRQSLRDDIRLEFDFADGAWPVEVDPSQLQMALINIAANSRDAMPRGGVFRVKIENRDRTQGNDGEHVAVILSDTGIGIAREALPKVFEPFFTTKEVGHGTGLGLAQVYGFAEQSGGTVDIRSEVGHGTEITLLLPRGSHPSSEREAEARPSRSRGPPLRILLVEDNMQVAEVAKSLLAERGHDVSHAASAEEAMRMLDSHPLPNVVFSDLVMPGPEDGLDLARRIRDRWPEIAILLATGYSDAADRVMGEGFKLIAKPYEADVLDSAIQEVTAAGRRNAGRGIGSVTRG